MTKYFKYESFVDRNVDTLSELIEAAKDIYDKFGDMPVYVIYDGEECSVNFYGTVKQENEDDKPEYSLRIFMS